VRFAVEHAAARNDKRLLARANLFDGAASTAAQAPAIAECATPILERSTG
jgi:hypothetical protein